MIALYLLASHLIGDFLLQTRWQSAYKFDNWRYRMRHVGTYTLAFVPVVWWRLGADWRDIAFLAALAALHFLTDSRRFQSTPGETIWYRWQTRKRDTPPLKVNPWASLPLMIDQTLHVCQIAVLAGVLL